MVSPSLSSAWVLFGRSDVALSPAGGKLVNARIDAIVLSESHAVLGASEAEDVKGFTACATREFSGRTLGHADALKNK